MRHGRSSSPSSAECLDSRDRVFGSEKKAFAGGLIAFCFLSLVTVPSPGSPAETELANKGFSPAWIQTLRERGGPRWYTGNELDHIGQAVGGLFAGQLYLGGDGRLWCWDIFNETVVTSWADQFYNNPMAPGSFRQVSSGFVLDLSDRAVPLDGRGFDQVEFRGEYPIAKLNMSDGGVPLYIELEAFSPFSPTETAKSSLPATLLCYKVTNTSGTDVTFRLGGWLENATDRQAVQAGTLIHQAEVLAGSSPAVVLSAAIPEQVPLPDIPFADFENGYGAWTTTGTAFGGSPFHFSDLAEYQVMENYQGSYFVNGHNTREAPGVGADELTGTLTSPVFQIDRKYLSLLIGGGSHSGQTEVQVLVGGQVVASARGENSNVMRRIYLDLTAYAGQQAQIKLIDTHSGGWGHISADDFVFTNLSTVILDSDSGSMAIALLGDDGDVLSPASLPGNWVAALGAVGDAVPGNSGVVRSAEQTLAPGESREFRFALCWHFANGHLGTLFSGEITDRADQRNHYAKDYADAKEVADYLEANHGGLTATTRLWRDTWYDSSLPYWFLDRTFMNASTLATTTAFRLHDPTNPTLDGRVYFWEGTSRFCPGTCTHVTSYEQAFGRLFPDAARAQRRITDFGAGWNDELGFVQYRAEATFGEHFGIPHALDGNAGTVLRTYREHSTSTDNAFLTAVWPRVKRATQFMIDQDAGAGFFTPYVPAAAQNQPADGIIEGPQYNTLDRSWYGVIPWTSGVYLASLRAAAEMAADMGDAAFAATCSALATSGGIELSSRTFNNTYGYYTQILDPAHPEAINSNIGAHIDQVLGDYWTHQAGLDQVLPADNTRSALGKLFEHNFYSAIGPYRDAAEIKVFRFFADYDEPGMVICSFPHGGAAEAVAGEAGLTGGFFSECMTGFTYQAAAHMISEGLVTEGLALCRAIHDRYAEAPDRRNPFNEIEYGNHYTRAMSGYAPFISASGFRYHGPKGMIAFAPKVAATNYGSAFVAAEGWGSYRRLELNRRVTETISVKNGSLKLNEVECSVPGDTEGFLAKVLVNGTATPASFALDGPVIRCSLVSEENLSAGDSIELVYTWAALPADTDEDGDGLTDLEEVSGINDANTPEYDPEGQITDPVASDSDLDGTPDGAEARLGLSPNSATESFAASVGMNAEGDPVVTWPSNTQTVFSVERSEDLVHWQTLTTNAVGLPGSTSYADASVPAGATRCYYRVCLNAP